MLGILNYVKLYKKVQAYCDKRINVIQSFIFLWMFSL